MKRLNSLLLILLATGSLSGCCEVLGTCDNPLAVVEVVEAKELPVAPVSQNTPVWCWLATGEMVFRYNSIPNVNPAAGFQCGIVGILYPACSFSCLNCVVSAGSLAAVNDMIIRYPVAVRQYTGVPVPLLATMMDYRPLTLNETMTELDAGMPILVGINPSGFRLDYINSEHVALIVGYQRMSDGSTRVLVNDPWPYALNIFQGKPDPYLQAGGVQVRPGQYSIEFGAFGQRLSWGQSIHQIRRAQTVSLTHVAPGVGSADPAARVQVAQSTAAIFAGVPAL